AELLVQRGRPGDSSVGVERPDLRLPRLRRPLPVGGQRERRLTVGARGRGRYLDIAAHRADGHRAEAVLHRGPPGGEPDRGGQTDVSVLFARRPFEQLDLLEGARSIIEARQRQPAVVADQRDIALLRYIEAALAHEGRQALPRAGALQDAVRGRVR